MPALIGRNFGASYSCLEELGVELAGVLFTAHHNANMANLDVGMGFPAPAAMPGQGTSRRVHSPPVKLPPANTSAHTPRLSGPIQTCSHGLDCTTMNPSASSANSS
jgi:hypothetical protein